MATKKERVSLQTPVGIATFVHVFEPHAHDNDDGEKKQPMYSVMLVFTPEQKDDLKELRQQCIRAAKAFFGERYEKLKEKGKMRFPWRDAGEYEEYGEPFVEGNTMINFKSKDEPGVVDARAKPVMDRKVIFPGMAARVSYGVWPYETKGNTGVTLFLNNLQKAGDGMGRLAGRAAAEDEFDAIEGADGSDDGDDDEI